MEGGKTAAVWPSGEALGFIGPHSCEFGAQRGKLSLRRLHSKQLWLTEVEHTTEREDSTLPTDREDSTLPDCMKEVDKCFVLCVCVCVCLSFGLSAYLKTAQTVDTRTQSCKTASPFFPLSVFRRMIRLARRETSIPTTGATRSRTNTTKITRTPKASFISSNT